MIVEDKTRIKKVILKKPELMASDAEDLIKAEYYIIQNMENDLADLRMKAIELEKKLAKAKQEFRDKSSLFELEFETKNIDYHTEECNMIISNSSDARYASYGQ